MDGEFWAGICGLTWEVLTTSGLGKFPGTLILGAPDSVVQHDEGGEHQNDESINDVGSMSFVDFHDESFPLLVSPWLSVDSDVPAADFATRRVKDKNVNDTSLKSYRSPMADTT